jgi:L-alanine-DL-glutamate epimerase-like enolase superfamily enzyme
MSLKMMFAYQEWPYRQTFEFARETREFAPLFLVQISDGTHIGRGECGLQSLKNETRDGIVAQLQEVKNRISDIASRQELNRVVPPCSARNAVDAALWDLECKRAEESIWQRTGIRRPEKIEVDITIGINPTQKMCADAQVAVSKGYRLLKIKSDAKDILDRIGAISAVAPGARFIVDANEAWSMEQLRTLAPALKSLNVILIEQPLHHEKDAPLIGYDCPIPLCADESCATRDGLSGLAKRYDAVNIKLDKSGGLTEALQLARDARDLGMGLMMGCNGATSLGNAPAYVVGSLCDWRDIDSQELLFEDRAGGMVTRNGELFAFDRALWG